MAVLIETETSWGGRVIRGIAHFAEKHTHWHLLIDPRDHEQRSAIPEGWHGDGIIARITNRTQWQQIREKGLPVVNVDDVYQGLRDVGTVITDEARTRAARARAFGRPRLSQVRLLRAAQQSLLEESRRGVQPRGD